MKDLPDTPDSIVLRTDFSDEEAWERVCREIETPVGDFHAYVSFVGDPEYEGLGLEELTALGRRGPWRSFMFVVDRTSLTHPEHPILVLDLTDDPGRVFRVVPREMWGVENNLSIANMDFSDFADRTDTDGVFRGFPET